MKLKCSIRHVAISVFVGTMLYVGSYVLNSAGGGYWMSPERDGSYQLGGLSTHTAIQWQTRFGYHSRYSSELLGSVYAPLVALDRKFVHPTHNVCDSDITEWADTLPLSQIHPVWRESYSDRRMGDNVGKAKEFGPESATVSTLDCDQGTNVHVLFRLQRLETPPSGTAATVAESFRPSLCTNVIPTEAHLLLSPMEFYAAIYGPNASWLAFIYGMEIYRFVPDSTNFISVKRLSLKALKSETNCLSRLDIQRGDVLFFHGCVD